MKDYMGIPHKSIPPLKSDKVMSDLHKRHRRFVGKLKENTLGKKEHKLEESVHWNRQHKKDHGKAEIKSSKMLKKLRENNHV